MNKISCKKFYKIIKTGKLDVVVDSGSLYPRFTLFKFRNGLEFGRVKHITEVDGKRIYPEIEEYYINN